MPSLPSAPYKGLHATGERKTMNTSEFTNGVLLIYNHPLWSNAPTILEHVNAFAAHSQFNVWTVNTEGGFPPALRSLRFRVILLHYSLFGYWPNLQLSDSFLRYLSECGRSYKIAFFQDEYQFCQQRFGFVNRYGIDSVYTLVEPELFDAVYRRYTGVQSLIYTIPGYVSDDLVERGRKLGKPDEVRRIDIGYRGRRLDYSMGRGAQEKSQIAHLFLERSRGLDLRLDIGIEESERIYGEGWYKFLADCRGVLGVEAGVSIFDLEDRVRIGCEQMLSENPGLSFDAVSRKLIRHWEGNIYYRTISPRHFEAAALGVCQILFEGRYSGILQPMEHYIPLKKDFSNFDDVIRLFRDESVRKRLTDNAYRDLIASGAYSYKHFVEDFDRHLLDSGICPPISPAETQRVSEALARGRVRFVLRAFLKALRYYPYPGKAFITKPIKPLVRKYRDLRQNGRREAFTRQARGKR